MINKNRDTKFIIYQVLYIFVITVLALKGADLNLREVVNKDKSVNLSVRDSLVNLIDSLYKKGEKFEVQINPVKQENLKLKRKVAELDKKFKTLRKKIIDTTNEDSKAKLVKNDEQTVAQSPISLALTFIKYTWNKAKNNGNVVTRIYDPRDMRKPIVEIPPGEERKFNLKDQDEVIAKYGSQQQTIKVLENKLPKILIKEATTKMNEPEIYVQELQKVTAYNVIIRDERPGQLKVVYRGPISVSGPFKTKDGDLVYNVSLKIAPTEEIYNKWIDRYGEGIESNGRYKVNFFFTVTDTISKARKEIGDSFYFTDYAR